LALTLCVCLFGVDAFGCLFGVDAFGCLFGVGAFRLPFFGVVYLVLMLD